MNYFIYSSHKSRDAAEQALEDYFANGEISEAEHPRIRKVGARWVVEFPG